MIRSVVGCLGLAELIDEKVELLKRHWPYHESDHVLSLAYSMMCGEKTLDGLAARREDEAYLDALSARRIPHPTTAGTFLRRFNEPRAHDLLAVLNECSARVWRQREPSAKKLAVIDIDGTIAETTGECREQMSMAYEGTWGYHPLVVSLAKEIRLAPVAGRNEGSRIASFCEAVQGFKVSRSKRFSLTARPSLYLRFPPTCIGEGL